MICFLAKFFIKDNDKVNLPSVRQSYGVLSGATGIAFNIILFLSKFFAGLVSGSIAIMGDAFNNLSDAASSVVTLVGFKLSGQEADEDHPFGHGRIEYIAGLIVSLFIVIMGVELIHSSFDKIFHPEKIEFNATIGVILLFSICIKLIMFQGNMQASKKISSAALKNTAIDSISDVFTTSIVLICAIINYYMGLNIDGFVGIVVGLLIIKAGIDAARDTISPLLGEPPSKELVNEIITTVTAHEGILGAHDLVVHNYGPTRIFMSLHVEVPADKDIIAIHDLIDDIENELHQKYHCTAVIHMDPVVVKDDERDLLKRKVKHLINELDPDLNFHDFRLVHSGEEGKKLTFDLEVPYKYDLSDDHILDYLKDHIKGIDPELEIEVTIDKEKKEKQDKAKA